MSSPVNKKEPATLLTGVVQDEILRRMLAAYRRMEAGGDRHNDGFFLRGLEVWGVRWDHLRHAAGWELPAQAAAASRALRRLEQRGLVQRRNQTSGDQYSAHRDADPADWRGRKHRTTHVRFTPQGRELATRLTNGAGHFVNPESP